jgi:hypothetical protein
MFLCPLSPFRSGPKAAQIARWHLIASAAMSASRQSVESKQSDDGIGDTWVPVVDVSSDL